MSLDGQKVTRLEEHDEVVEELQRPIRSAYDGSRVRVCRHCEAESLTQQHFKDSCDINNIMAKYMKTGMIDHLATHGEQYGFMSGATFTEQMMAIAQAQTMFNELPAKVRERFGHDPAAFLDYAENIDQEDPQQLAELYELGMTNTKPEAFETVDDHVGVPAGGPSGAPELAQEAENSEGS